jgi:AraC-like DNA-binding protein
MYEPSVCFVAQGAKSVTLGDETYVYDARNYLISSLHLPGLVQIVEASREKPYLGLVLRLDLREISQLVLDGNLPPPRGRLAKRGMATGEVCPPLIGAVQRLVDLLSQKDDIPILAPLIRREIHYRLLVGEQGERLRQIALAGSQPHRIAQAIDWLKENFKQPLSVDDLAGKARMSASAFHHHFRAMTAISPLQFQKQLRLQEARRLMLERQMDAATAAFQVGYESPSQFSREYVRLFGTPPLRDVTKLRKFMAGEARA